MLVFTQVPVLTQSPLLTQMPILGCKDEVNLGAEFPDSFILGSDLTGFGVQVGSGTPYLHYMGSQDRHQAHILA